MREEWERLLYRVTHLDGCNLLLTLFRLLALAERQKVASVAAHELPEVPELSQREVVTKQNGHPVDLCTLPPSFCLCRRARIQRNGLALSLPSLG